MTRTMILVGTRKGAFILDGGRDRAGWSVAGPLCEGWPIHDLQSGPRDRLDLRRRRLRVVWARGLPIR